MKKMIAVLLSAVLVITFAGCMKSEEPTQAYAAALAKNQTLKSSDLAIIIKINGEINGKAMSNLLDITAKTAAKGDNDFDMAMKLSATSGEESMEMPMYYTDGYAYIELMEQKIKSKMDISSLTQNSELQPKLQPLEQDFFQEVAVSKKTQEGIVYTYTGNPDKAGEAAQKSADMLSSSLGGTAEVKVTKANGSFLINPDGYITEQILNLEYSATVNGATSTFTSSTTIKQMNPGQEVTVDFPDLSQYTEVEADLGSMFSGAA